MNLFEYLAQCSFWQWAGTILLCMGTAESLGGLIHLTYSKIVKKDET